MSADYKEAHKFSIHNREQIEAGEVCGCFYCLKIFSPAEISEWTDDEDTALCPYCGIDSIIGEKTGYPMTKEFLKKMFNWWF